MDEHFSNKDFFFLNASSHSPIESRTRYRTKQFKNILHLTFFLGTETPKNVSTHFFFCKKLITWHSYKRNYYRHCISITAS